MLAAILAWFVWGNDSPPNQVEAGSGSVSPGSDSTAQAAGDSAVGDQEGTNSGGSSRPLLEATSGIELVRIPAGSFTMGSPGTEVGREGSESPAHSVSVPAFELARTEVTNAQYGRFLEATGHREPPGWDRSVPNPAHPVVNVSWFDARAFCDWAGLRLPTEAEWEHACRARTTGPWSCAASELDEHAWSSDNCSELQPVATREPNPWKLFDMHGNAWEWCQDEWSDSYDESRKVHPMAFEPSGDQAHYRTYRGGSFNYPAALARSASRVGDEPSDSGTHIGFRPARDTSE